jgi:hypothetical protein
MPVDQGLLTLVILGASSSMLVQEAIPRTRAHPL